MATFNENGPNGHHETLDTREIPPMGMTGQQFIEAASSVINDVEQYFSTLPTRPVLPSVQPGYLRKMLPTAAPEQGESFAEIERDVERTIMPGVSHWQHPKFMAFFPATVTYPSILGEIWSAALTAPAFNWICSPVVTELETIVLDWLAKLLHLPECFLSSGKGGGVIQGSASEAIVTVMVAARERFVRRQIEREGITDAEEAEDRACAIRSTLVALGSDQAHSSTKKGSNIAGTRFRTVPTRRDVAFAMQGEDLKAKIDELLARGLNPYYVTITLGSTNTCAVDNFLSIARVMAAYPDIWIHVDAAYAGTALIVPQYAELASQLAFVDSFDTNLHKWLLVNFDASTLYVRERNDLTAALSISASYLRNDFSSSGLVTDYRDWQIPLGRRFRALKIWFVLRTFGAEGLKRHLTHHLRLGALFASLVESRPDLFTITVPPAFALTVFAINPPTTSAPESEQDRLAKQNATTDAVVAHVDAKREFWLTASKIEGTSVIRVVSANALAEEKYVREVFAQLVEAAEAARAV